MSDSLRPTARDKTLLQRLGITHVVNAAHGPAHIDTGADFYSDTSVEYHGVEAPDNRDFDITPFFYPTASFIHKALSKQSKTLCTFILRVCIVYTACF